MRLVANSVSLHLLRTVTARPTPLHLPSIDPQSLLNFINLLDIVTIITFNILLGVICFDVGDLDDLGLHHRGVHATDRATRLVDRRAIRRLLSRTYHS